MRRESLPLALLAIAAVGCGGSSDGGSASKPGAAAWAYEKEFGPGPVRLVLRLDRTEATLADTILVEEELRIEEGFEAELPEYLPEDFEGFAVTDVITPADPSRAAGREARDRWGRSGRRAIPTIGRAQRERKCRLALVSMPSGHRAAARHTRVSALSSSGR